MLEVPASARVLVLEVSGLAWALLELGLAWERHHYHHHSQTS